MQEIQLESNVVLRVPDFPIKDRDIEFTVVVGNVSYKHIRHLTRLQFYNNDFMGQIYANPHLLLRPSRYLEFVSLGQARHEFPVEHKPQYKKQLLIFPRTARPRRKQKRMHYKTACTTPYKQQHLNLY